MGEIRHTGSQGGPWVASTRRTWVSSNTSPPLNPPRWGWLRAASPRSPPQLLPRPGAAPLGAAQAAASPARTALLPHFLQPRRPRKRKACREPIPAIHPLGPAELPPALRDAGEGPGQPAGGPAGGGTPGAAGRCGAGARLWGRG